MCNRHPLRISPPGLESNPLSHFVAAQVGHADIEYRPEIQKAAPAIDTMALTNVFVVAGTGIAHIKGARIPLKMGTLLLIEHGEQHEIRNTGKGLLETLNLYSPPGYTKDGDELPAGKPKYYKRIAIASPGSLNERGVAETSAYVGNAVAIRSRLARRT